MKKLILISLLSFNVNALEVQRYGEGYMFRWVEDGKIQCWGMPDLADLNLFNPSWMKVSETAVRYNWPLMPVDQASMCEQGKIYRTQAGWLYSINHNLGAYRIMQIPSGIPCGEQITYLPIVRAVTYQGQKGFAVCS